MKLVCVQEQIKNRRIAYGETISPCSCLTGIGITPLIFGEAVLHIVGFPAPVSPLLGDIDIFAEKLVSDALLPFAKTNFHMMSSRKRRSLYQELHGVDPSSRRIILSSKSEMKAVIGHAAHDPIEKHPGELLGRIRIFSENLKLLVLQVCDTTGVPSEGAHPFRRSTKREVLEWIEESWSTLGEAFATIAANQGRVGH
jgi:hypothetical protein